MNEPLQSPDIITGGNLATASNSTGFDRGTSRKGILRKAVDYNASVIKYLEASVLLVDCLGGGGGERLLWEDGRLSIAAQLGIEMNVLAIPVVKL